MRVLRDVQGNSRSVGFVQYYELEDALAALKGMNGRQVHTCIRACWYLLLIPLILKIHEEAAFQASVFLLFMCVFV